MTKLGWKSLRWIVLLVFWMTNSDFCILPAAPPIDQLVLKGTHNSYQCEGDCDITPTCSSPDPSICNIDPPWVDHSLRVQIDDFWGWAVELDFPFFRTAP